MTVAGTSLEAYAQILPELGYRQLEVYNALRRLRYATNTMISKVLGIPINCVTGRIYELRNDKKLVGFAFKSKCEITGKNANYWKVLDRRLI